MQQEFVFSCEPMIFFFKYAWVILLKDKSETTSKAFEKTVKETNCKPNKTYQYKNSEF